MEEAGAEVQQPHPSADTERWMLPFPGGVRFAQSIRCKGSRAKAEPATLWHRRDCSVLNHGALQAVEMLCSHLSFLPGITGQGQKTRGVKRKVSLTGAVALHWYQHLGQAALSHQLSPDS